MSRGPFSRLKTRLLILVVFATLPGFGLTLYAGMREQAHAASVVAQDALRLARLASFDQGRVVEGAHQLLIALARLPEVRSGNPEACDNLFTDLLNQFPLYANFGVIRLDGSVLCSALPYDPSINLADRAYFQRALETRGFAAGEYQVGRITGIASLNFGYPVFDAEDEVQSIVFAAVDLTWFDQLAAQPDLPPGSILMMVDHNGTILARYPDPEVWTGQTRADTPLIQTILLEAEGTTVTAGLDGVERIYGFTRLDGALAGSGVYVSVGIPTEVAFAESDHLLAQSLGGLAVVFLLVFAVAWIGTDLFILRPVGSLMRTTRRLQAGDLSARSGMQGGISELHQLAHAFDEMALSLQTRMAELEQAGMELRAGEVALRRSNQRLGTLHAIDRAILAVQSSEDVVRLALQSSLVHGALLAASLVIFDPAAEQGLVFGMRRKDDHFEALERRVALQIWGEEDITALQSGATQLIAAESAPSQLPPGLQLLTQYGSRAFLRVPLIADKALIGTLNLGAENGDVFTPEYVEIAREIVDQVAIAIQQARLREQNARYAAELEQRVLERTAELQGAKERVEAILNSTSDAILLVGADSTIQQTNRMFDTLFGYAPDELFGQPLTRIVVPGDARQLTEAIHAVLNLRQHSRIEIVAWRKDGTTFDADLALASSEEGGGIRTKVICSLRDISVHKHLEAELRQAVDKEKELNALKSRFVSMVSHEFRTPLASILSSNDLLKTYSERLSDEKKAALLDRIGIQVRRLTDLLDGILTLSRAETVGLEVSPIPFDLEAFCQSLIEEIQVSTQATHQIVFSTQGWCREFVGDEKLLRQIVSNLLTNAIKYSPQGSTVTFDLSCEESQAVIRVNDEGVGIPEEDQKRLFETFHRAANVGHVPGTGLGLVIVKQAVEAHGGTIAFESEVGMGTAFTVRLPMSPSQ